MKQKKLINDEEESLGTDPIEDKVSEENEHYMDDFYQDYRSLKASVDYNDEEYRHASALNEKIYQVFHESRWCALGPNKKIPKDLIPFIFQEMFEATAETDFVRILYLKWIKNLGSYLNVKLKRYFNGIVPGY